MNSDLIGRGVRISSVGPLDTNWEGEIRGIGLHEGQVILLIRDWETNQLVRISMDECLVSLL